MSESEPIAASRTVEVRSATSQLRVLLRALLRSDHRRRVGWIAGGLVLAVAGNAIGQIRLNIWQGDFFDALEGRMMSEFLFQTLVFLGLVAVLLSIVVAQTWLVEMLKLRLRDWLTEDLVARWLVPTRAYRLGLAGEIGRNPDQRIHEDTRKLTELTAELGVGMLQASSLLVSFIGVLWILSAGVVLHFGETSFSVPGYMVWCALAYSGAGSFLAWAFGRPLVRINDMLYGREAELRFGLVRVSESAEGIALYRGEADERERLRAILARVIDVMVRRAGALARLTWVTSGYGWLAIVVPVFVAAPGYFGGALSFGGLMMVVGAFNQVQQALRWFVDNVSRIADWRATLTRVMVLRDALDEIDRAARPEGAERRLRVLRGEAPRLELRDLVIDLADGTARIGEGDVVVNRGECVMFEGARSAGKSTLFRAIAGLWPWGEGEIRLPGQGGMLFLPNHPYLPPGSLHASVSYPGEPGSFDEERVGAALAAVGLDYLVSQLGRVARWDRELALDEQQRVTFARVLLHRPGWLFIDDAMSALGAGERREIRDLLMQEFPDMSILAFERDGSGEEQFPRCLHVVRIETVGEHGTRDRQADEE